MQFDSLSDFLAMGGYGFYVWLSVGVCMAALVFLVLLTLTDKKRLIKQIKHETARQQRMQKARQSFATSQHQHGISNESQT
ncbi:heme exporter protein CcmD [Salinimonas chungwhensis]|uniref:heme exporter protein CcmD n=1 Tax=Salinimonas chungwhensis TaxID=265425 RepID=UPI00035E77A5|nr:heme exporter protein CcmD [Salinimonas chungwhensis]